MGLQNTIVLFKSKKKAMVMTTNIQTIDGYLLTLGAELIKLWEGCELKPYLCSGGVLTIGYGSTKGITSNLVINQHIADLMFRAEYPDYLQKTAELFNDNALHGVTPACLLSWNSLCYNVGHAAVEKSRALFHLRKMVEGNNYTHHFERCLQEYKDFNVASGKRSIGLLRRRCHEIEFWLNLGNTSVTGPDWQGWPHYNYNYEKYDDTTRKFTA